MSIATKIFIAFTAVIVLFTSVLMFGIYRSQTTYEQIQSINRSVVPLSLTLSDVQTDLKSYSIILNEKDPLVLRRTLQVTRLAPSVPDRFKHKMERAAKIARQAQFETISGPNHENLANTRARVAELREAISNFALSSQEFTDLVLSGEETEPDQILIQQSKLRSRARKIDSQLTSLRSDLRAATNVGLARAKELERTSLYYLSAASIAALVMAILVLIAVLFTMRRLTLLTEAAKRIGEGDYGPLEELPERPAQDEIGTLTREFDSMARSIAERDQALRDQHAKLIKSERLATVGRMTSLITHELRNPLSSINLNAEMLMDSIIESEGSEQDEELRTTLETIINEVDRLRDITEEYLVYARMPSPRPDEHELQEILQALLDFHLWEWLQEDVEVLLEMPEEQVLVNVDASQIRQALLNIVKNAVEASKKGATVRVTLESDDAMAVIRVEDDAGGIPENVREQIFEPFFTTKSSGTGLGLAMTQEIVEEHSGDLSIVATETGTRFEIRLPRG